MAVYTKERKQKSNCDDQEFHFITVATKPHPNLDLLCETARHHGYPEIKVLAMHDKRFVRTGKNFGVKLESVKDYVMQLVQKKKGNTIVLFTDAYDVLIVEDANVLLKKYHCLDSDVVFSAEKLCRPNRSLATDYPTHEIPGLRVRYLNSGTFIGRADAILTLFNSRPFAIADDDQTYWSKVYLEYNKHSSLFGKSKLISLDVHSSIFQCMVRHRNLLDCLPEQDKRSRYDHNHNHNHNHHNNMRAKFLIQKDGKVQNPCVLHFNGLKVDLPRFYKQWKENKVISRSFTQGILQWGRAVVDSFFD